MSKEAENIENGKIAEEIGEEGALTALQQLVPTA
jgi:hypothetical protein